MDKENAFLNSRNWRAGRVFNYRTLVVHGLLSGKTTAQDTKVLRHFMYQWRQNPEYALTMLKRKFRGLDDE